MNKCLVMFSGGQDSATCLFWALQNYDYVETVKFDYNQRHKVELDVRQEFLDFLKNDFKDLHAKLGNDHAINATNLSELGETAMTAEIEIEFSKSGLPTTFVPGRNLYFFTMTSAIGYRRDIYNLVGGMCETDYSGYPDCRRTTMDNLEKTLSLGMDKEFKIITPLMWIDKANTWKMAQEIGDEKLVEGIKKYTHSCYKETDRNFMSGGMVAVNVPHVNCEVMVTNYGKNKRIK